jgi:hypothetical protein
MDLAGERKKSIPNRLESAPPRTFPLLFWNGPAENSTPLAGFLVVV